MVSLNDFLRWAKIGDHGLYPVYLGENMLGHTGDLSPCEIVGAEVFLSVDCVFSAAQLIKDPDYAVLSEPLFWNSDGSRREISNLTVIDNMAILTVD